MSDKPTYEELKQQLDFLKNKLKEKSKLERELVFAHDIIRRSPAVIFIWHNQRGWPVEYVSENVETIFGYTKDDFLSHTIQYEKLIHPDDLERVFAEVLSSSNNRNLKNIEHEPYKIITKTGDIRWIKDFTSVHRDEHADVIHYEGVILDITEQQGLEDRLRFIEFAVDNAAEGICWIDKAGKVIYANKAECERLGYTRRELLQKTVFDIDTNMTPANWVEHWNMMLQQGSMTFESEHRNASNDLFHVEATITAFMYHGEKYSFAFSRDISERKRTQIALEKQVLALTRPLDGEVGIQFDELFNIREIQLLQDQFAKATGVASIITHPDGGPITNPSNFTRLCNDIVRKTEKGRKNCEASDATAIGTVRNDGPIIRPCLSCGLWDAGAPIVVGGHHVANWLIGQVRDKDSISRERVASYAEEIGADINSALEAFEEIPKMSKDHFIDIAHALYNLANQLSNSAYQNIQQARFISERDRAEKEKEKIQLQYQQTQRLESVGRLAGGVAHDLNNLLSPILGYSEMLQEDLKDNAQATADIEQIITASLKARDIVRQLLAFSRKQTMQVSAVNLNSVLAQFVTLIERTIRENIELKIIPAEKIEPITADQGQLEQVVMNLLVNAQDAMPNGGVLTIETAVVDFDSESAATHMGLKDGRYVMLAISDSGKGMDSETRKHIFEPFYTTKGQDGTGLGLATVYGIVKQHGGEILVYSELQNGTTFKVYLPVSGETAADPKKEEPTNETTGGSETLLLVEDEPQVREMTASLLARQGYRILTAENGKQALELFAYNLEEIDLLITDVIMPHMNGRELYETIGTIKAEMKVLYMSGYTNNVITNHGGLGKNINFIQKPFSSRDLYSRVRAILDD